MDPPSGPHRPSNANRKATTEAKKKRKKKQDRLIKEMENCDIEESDASDVDFDFEKPRATPASSPNWAPPITDYWEPQDGNNKKCRVLASQPETTHRLTQNEIYAKHPTQPKDIPLGRLKILKHALAYMKKHRVHGRPSQCAV